MGAMAGRITSAPSDPLFAVVAYLSVIVGLLIALAPARTPVERAVRLLFLYIVYGTLEVAVKRFTHFAWYVYPLKFGLFFLVVMAWWMARRSLAGQRPKRPLTLILSLYIALAAIQIFNPNQGNPVVGVLGWMTDFMYVVLYFVGFDLLRDEQSVRRLMWLTAALGVVSALSCLTEMWVGAEELQRLYPTFVPLQVYTDVGDILYRPTSLVPYMELFGIAAMVGLLALRGLWRPILAVGIALCVLASLFHAIRITWVVLFLFLSLFILLGRRKNWAGALVVIACVFGSIQLLDLGNSMVSQSLNSMTTPAQTFQSNRLAGVLDLQRVVTEYPLGLGVGELSPGLRFLDTRGATRLGTHNYLTDLAGQMSLIGPVLLLAFGCGIGYRGVRALWQPLGSEARGIAVKTLTALFGALLISFFGGGALGAYPSNEYFWLMAGIIARLTSPIMSVRRPQAARIAAGQLAVRTRGITIVGSRTRARA